MSSRIFDLFSLRGKVALVTGGAGYLGTAISETLLELGADVLVASRDGKKCEERCDELNEQVAAGGRAYPHELDVTSPDSVRACVAEVDQRWGGLDVLVNNAWSGRKNTIESISEEDWAQDVEMSLTSVFRCTQAALDGIKRKQGVVLNVASMYGHIAPDPWLYEGTDHTNPPSYGAAKAGTIQFTRYLASFLATHGVRVNCISPGAFPHPPTREQHEFAGRLASKAPLGRVGDPYDLKGAVAFLCTPASGFVTGENLRVDGGWSIR